MVLSEFIFLKLMTLLSSLVILYAILTLDTYSIFHIKLDNNNFHAVLQSFAYSSAVYLTVNNFSLLYSYFLACD